MNLGRKLIFTHTDIWRGIDRLAASSGYSASGLARRAGLDPTSFNKSKRISPDGKPRWPSTESIAKILGVTNLTMADFISLIDAGNDTAPSSALSQTSDIPMLGFAQAGQHGYFDEDGYPAGDAWDKIPFPDEKRFSGDACYALKINGKSMEPVYREKDILIVCPASQTFKGDRIVVKTRAGEVMAKEVEKKSSRLLTLKSLNPDFKTLEIPLGDIEWTARILWVSQ